MITVSNVTKGYGGRTLFKEVNASFSSGRNYGLTGPNGSGKSTFMKIIMGLETPDKGHVSLPKRTGWLRQEQSAYDDQRVIDTVIMGSTALWEALQEQEILYAKEDFSDDDGIRLGELEQVVGEEDGYTAEADAAVLLDGIGVPSEHHERTMAELQGGMKVRVLLAQALFGKPEALLLDEPTNALDMESIIWLEHFLSAYNGVLILISHDRRFLNSVCNHIADIDYESIIPYTGNYNDMVRMKAQVHSSMAKDNAAREKKIEQLNDFIQRFGAGTRASQTRSRQKQVERLRPDEIKRSNIARPYIRFTVGDTPSGRDVLSVERLSKSYGEQVIFSEFSSMIQRGDKIALIGRNGIGKTTLIHALMDDEKIQSGAVKWGHQAKVGVFGHHHRNQIDEGTTVFKWLFSQRPDAGENEVRSVLGRMLFSGEDGKKPTTTLSGGEAARLVLCKLILCQYNVLLLDEPTDHLDLESVSAMREAISVFEGTVIYVTHDRDLASAANRIWSYAGDQDLIDYDGPIDHYLDWYETHYQDQE
jgi:ATPase subunit of ABC transporter with duplicated ATPase domains